MEDYRTRRKEQAKQTEQAILQAAMDLSRKQSFDKVSIREICQQARSPFGRSASRQASPQGPFTITFVPRRTCSPGALPRWTLIWSRPSTVTRTTLPPTGYGG